MKEEEVGNGGRVQGNCFLGVVAKVGGKFGKKGGGDGWGGGGCGET